MSLRNIDLYRKHDQMVALKKQTYDKLFNRCINTIKNASNAGELICFYEIPTYLFGEPYPEINVEACAHYIIHKLAYTNNNIKATLIVDHILFLDWRREEDTQRVYNGEPIAKNNLFN